MKAPGGRQIGDQHRAMVAAGIDPAFRLRWLARQIAETEADLTAHVREVTGRDDLVVEFDTTPLDDQP